MPSIRKELTVDWSKCMQPTIIIDYIKDCPQNGITYHTSFVFKSNTWTWKPFNLALVRNKVQLDQKNTLWRSNVKNNSKEVCLLTLDTWWPIIWFVHFKFISYFFQLKLQFVLSRKVIRMEILHRTMVTSNNF